jgi:hypothetical protein
MMGPKTDRRVEPQLRRCRTTCGGQDGWLHALVRFQTRSVSSTSPNLWVCIQLVNEMHLGGAWIHKTDIHSGAGQRLEKGLVSDHGGVLPKSNLLAKLHHG